MDRAQLVSTFITTIAMVLDELRRTKERRPIDFHLTQRDFSGAYTTTFKPFHDNPDPKYLKDYIRMSPQNFD